MSFARKCLIQASAVLALALVLLGLPTRNAVASTAAAPGCWICWDSWECPSDTYQNAQCATYCGALGLYDSQGCTEVDPESGLCFGGINIWICE